MTLPLAAIVALYLILSLRLPPRPIISRRIRSAVYALLALTVPMVFYAVQKPADLCAGIAFNPVIGADLMGIR